MRTDPLAEDEYRDLLRRLDEASVGVSEVAALAGAAVDEIRALRRIAPRHIEPAHVDTVLRAASELHAAYERIQDPEAKLDVDDKLTGAFRYLEEALSAWRGDPPCEYCRRFGGVCGPHPRKDGDFFVGDIVRPSDAPSGVLGRVREIFPWRMGGGASLIVDWLEGPDTTPTRVGSCGSSVTTAGRIVLVERPEK